MEGVNSRLDGLQAAILGVKLRHLVAWTEKRRENAYMYNKCLMNSNVSTPTEILNVKAVYHLYVIRVGGGMRDKIREHLKLNGISTGIHYPVALPNLKAYSYLCGHSMDYPNATRMSKEILSLPMYPEMTGHHIEYIAAMISGFLDNESIPIMIPR